MREARGEAAAAASAAREAERAVQEAMRLLSTWKNDRANTEPTPPVWGKRGN